MKFIVDAQLPKALSDFLKYRGYDSIHTLELPEGNASSDKIITTLATDENRAVITKDADFLDSHLLHGLPQKLIIVKTGNIPNSALIHLFNIHLDEIVSRIRRSALLEISTIEIIEHSD